MNAFWTECSLLSPKFSLLLFECSLFLFECSLCLSECPCFFLNVYGAKAKKEEPKQRRASYYSSHIDYILTDKRSIGLLDKQGRGGVTNRLLFFLRRQNRLQSF
jgi:hypothetical protein